MSDDLDDLPCNDKWEINFNEITSETKEKIIKLIPNINSSKVINCLSLEYLSNNIEKFSEILYKEYLYRCFNSNKYRKNILENIIANNIFKIDDNIYGKNYDDKTFFLLNSDYNIETLSIINLYYYCFDQPAFQIDMSTKLFEMNYNDLIAADVKILDKKPVIHNIHVPIKLFGLKIIP